jgi:hypothetical protein
MTGDPRAAAEYDASRSFYCELDRHLWEFELRIAGLEDALSLADEI